VKCTRDDLCGLPVGPWCECLWDVSNFTTINSRLSCSGLFHYENCRSKKTDVERRRGRSRYFFLAEEADLEAADPEKRDVFKSQKKNTLSAIWTSHGWSSPEDLPLLAAAAVPAFT
jgi:hypothetical protein